MFRLANFISLFFLLSIGACAFREPVPAVQNPIETYAIKASWSDMSSGPSGDSPIARRMTLNSGVLQSNDPITLPPNAPAQVDLSVVLPSGTSALNAQFAKATFTTIGVTHDVPIQILPEQSANGTLALRVLDLDSLLPQDQSQSGLLHVDVFSGSDKMFSFEQELRTPASNVAITAFGYEGFSQIQGLVSLPTRTLMLGQTTLSLVYAFQFQNQESLPVTIDLPRKASADLIQRQDNYNYYDQGCNGAGYVVEDQQSNQLLSDAIYLLPLRGSLLDDAEASLSEADESSSAIEMSIQPGETLSVGAFAAGAAALQWNLTGARPASLHNITVPSDCYQVCTDSDWPEHPGGSGHGGMVDAVPIGILQCIQWKTLRHTATVTVGYQRGDVWLSFDGNKIPYQIRYGDLNFSEDPELRQSSYSAMIPPLKWAPVEQ